MNRKYIYIISILVIAMIGMGCVDKSQNNSSTSVGTVDNVSTIEGDNASTDNLSTIEGDNASTVDNLSTTEGDNASIVDNESSGLNPVVNDTSSMTESFKIGDEKIMLGVNIKLVNIIDYDNNIVTIDIDNVEYKYDPESEDTIKAKGIEITDILTSKEDKTAEITVDYESSESDNVSTVNNESTSDLNPVVNDTSVTESFKIGDEKNMLGVNIKLLKIIDFNSNIVTIDIDNVEYKYDPELENTIQVKGVEIVDISTTDDNTAEITVDYASS